MSGFLDFFLVLICFFGALGVIAGTVMIVLLTIEYIRDMF